MIPGWLFPILALLVVVQIAALARVLPRLLRMRSKLRELGLDGRAGKSIRVDRQTVRAALEAVGGRKRMLILSLPVTTKATLRLRRENLADRLFKLLRIARELDVRDPGFDDAVYVETDYESFAQDWLTSPFARASILQLFESGAREVHISKGRLAVYWPVKVVDELTETGLNAWAKALTALHRGIEKAMRATRAAPVRAWWLRRAIAFLLGLPLLVASVVFWFLAYGRYPAVDDRALWFAVQAHLGYGALALLGLLVLTLRGHYHSHVALRKVLPFTLLAIVPAVAALVTWWNGAHSRGVSEVVVAATGKDWRGRSRDPEYVVVSSEFPVTALFSGARPVTVPVERGFWRDFDPARGVVALRIGNGALGVPWIEWRGVRITTPGPQQDTPAEAPNLAPDDTSPPPARAEPRREPPRQDPPAPSQRISKAPELLKAANMHYTARRYVDASIDYSSAIEELRAHAAPPTALADALWRRASTYAMLGPENDAAVEADCREALALNPYASGPTLILEGVMVRNGRLSEALALWNDYIPQRPKDGYALVKRALVLKALGQTAQAQQDAREACRRGEKTGCEFR
jgi:hypothetical protein